MRLSPTVSRYFDDWMCWEQWHSCHPLDNERFYRFVKAVARYSRKAPSRADVYALILERWSGQEIDLDDAGLDEAATEFAERYRMLMDYEKTKGFPNPLIERRSILEYYNMASAQCQGDKQRLNRKMTEAWGEDWQTKVDKAI